MNDELTSREEEILALMVDGLPNNEIAARLVLSIETIRWYNKQIYAKLGVHSRREAILKAQELGQVAKQQPSTPLQHNLPAETTPFVGRQAETEEIRALLLESNSRLVTIVATGGMGKTRLALHVARQLVGPYFPHGVYFVPLRTITNPTHFLTAIAEATGYQFQTDQRSPQQQILDYLRNKRMLLVLDNSELLVDDALMIIDLLEAAPELKIIVTAREQLHLHAADVFNLKELPFPTSSSSEDILEHDAVQLFVASAQRMIPTLELNKSNLALIAQICEMVAGMPLAIVLAAAWIEVLSLEEIAQELQESIDLLAAKAHDMPQRQSSIQSVFESTWNRLSKQQQYVFMKLAVFHGPFSREAAQHVAQANLQSLQTLIGKSLVQRTDEGRYEIHALLQHYVQEHLENTGMVEEARTAHCLYFSQLVQQQEHNIKGNDQLGGLDALETDFENVQAAWRWAVSQNAPDHVEGMLEGVFWFCMYRAQRHEGAELFELARQQWPASQNGISIAGRLINRFPLRSHDYLELAERAFVIAQQHDNQHEVAYCMQILGKHLSHQLHDTRGLVLLEESRASFEQLADDFYTAQVLDDIGWSNALLGQADGRIDAVQRCVELRRRCGDKIGEGAALCNLSAAYMGKGETETANILIEAASCIAREMHDQTNLTWTLLILGARMALQGETDKSQAAIDEGLALAIQLNVPDLKILGYAALGLLQGTMGDYASSQHTIAQGDLDDHLEQSDLTARIFACVASSLSEVGLGNIGRAEYFLKMGLHAVTYTLPSPAMVTWFFPQLVFVLAERGDTQQMLEVLALTLTHPARHCWWADTWKPLLQLQDDLKAAIGENRYWEIWERGQSLDLFDVAQEALAALS